MKLNAQRIRAEFERVEVEDPESALLRRVGARLTESRPRRVPRLWVGAAAVCSVLLALGLYLGRDVSMGSDVAAYIDGSESSIVGRWVKTGDETRQVHFADGSQLALFPNTEVKVEAASPEQTRVRLGDGRTHVHVVHGRSTDYRFQAGPFEIRVTGTKFDLSWQPSTEHLELALLEGGVVVTGPNLAVPRKVGPGEVLRLDSQKPTPSGTLDEPDPGSSERAGSSDAGASEQGGELELPVVPGEASVRAPAAAEETATWQALLGAGERKSAVRAAEARGAPRVLADGATSSILSLAQAARLEGSPHLARELLVGLREMRGERGQSAFYLGKIAYDQLGKKAEAQKWFETYLREAPTGTFAEQAWARLFELAGSSGQGRTWAREYLERYPSGASSARARSLLR